MSIKCALCRVFCMDIVTYRQAILLCNTQMVVIHSFA